MPIASHDHILIESDLHDTRHLDPTGKTTCKANLSDGLGCRCEVSLFQCVVVFVHSFDFDYSSLNSKE